MDDERPCHCLCGATPHNPRRITLGNGWCDGFSTSTVWVVMPNGHPVEMCEPCAVDVLSEAGSVA